MTWATVIDAILAIVGPIMAEQVKKWLSNLLSKTSKKVINVNDSPVVVNADGTRDVIDTTTTFPTTDAMRQNALNLITAARDSLPRVRFVQRAFLTMLAAKLPPVKADGQSFQAFGAGDKTELKGLAGLMAGDN